jgi:hypothetical protein
MVELLAVTLVLAVLGLLLVVVALRAKRAKESGVVWQDEAGHPVE